MKKNGIALAIILIILVMTLVACGENDLDTCEHNVVIDEAVSATCTEMGLTEGAHCSKCGEVLLAQTEVPALGHTAADAVKENEIAPTCTTAGSCDSVVYCFVCDAELSRETKSVDALDHNIVNHQAQAPTCTEVGWEAYEACSRCDYSTYVEIPATGHNHVPAVTVPTCTERGYTTYTCHCGDTYIGDGVPATGHNFEDNEYCLICSAEYYTEGLQFSLCKDEYTVTGIITSASDVTIPSTYQGLPVTEIAANAFYECTSLTSIVIPASVTTIDYNAFQYCSGLTNVTFGENSQLTTIGAGAFCKCTSLTSIVIPDSVTTIGNIAFYECTSLTSITIPDSVTTIGKNVFMYCSNLTSVTFGENSQLTTIGDGAFYDCRSLTSIVIPASVTSIGELAFSGSNVTDVYYKGDIAGWCGISFGDASANPMVYADNLYIDGKLVEGELVIPDSVTTIPIYAFRGCAVTSVTIPDGVTSIGNNAFSSCDNLTNVTFGNDSQLLEIGSFAFAYCHMLSEFNIPAGVINIDDCAFSYCYSIKTIFNYSSLDIVAGETTHGYIAEYADRIYDMTGDATLSEDEDGFVLYTKGNVCELVEYKGDATDVVIPDGITAINSRVFYDNDAIGMVFIPDGVTSIGNNAFFSCDNLTSVYYNGDVAGWCGITFGDSSANPMYYADNLYIDGKLVEGELVIPDSVTSIPEYAFRGQAITSVTIPDSVTTIGGFAFNYCTSLTNVTFGANSQLTTIGTSAFCICDNLTSIVIPDSVTTIGSDAFYSCNSLTSIVIPDSVTTIGSYAFSGCDSLTSIVIPDSVTTIDLGAFNNCTSLTSISVDENNPNYKSIDGNLYSKDGKTLVQYAIGKTATSFVIHDSVTTIGTSAFYDCDSLTSVTIGDSVTTIGSSAFGGCSSLTYNVYDNGKYLGNESNPYLVLVEATSTSITSCEINENCKVICEYAFDNCTSLTSVTIGDSVTSIGSSAFHGCTGLTSITIPDSVTTIGWYAFFNCYSLTSIVIPDSVTTIGNYAFRGCSNLTDVYYEGTEAQWNNISMEPYNTGLTNATIHYNYVNE